MLSLDGREFPVQIQKIDRDKLYGKIDIEAFDEKGKPRKLSEKEKKELKGDNPKLPGYKAVRYDRATFDPYGTNRPVPWSNP